MIFIIIRSIYYNVINLIYNNLINFIRNLKLFISNGIIYNVYIIFISNPKIVYTMHELSLKFMTLIIFYLPSPLTPLYPPILSSFQGG